MTNIENVINCNIENVEERLFGQSELVDLSERPVRTRDVIVSLRNLITFNYDAGRIIYVAILFGL